MENSAPTGEELYNIVFNEHVSFEEKAKVISDFKTHVKRELIDLKSTTLYFDSLLHALKSDSPILLTLSFSCLCHLIKRINIQDSKYLDAPADSVLPIIISRTGSSKSSIRKVAQSALMDYWLSCPIKVEHYIKILGLCSDVDLVRKSSITWLAEVLSIQPHLSFKQFTVPVVSLLNDLDPSISDLAKQILINFFSNSVPAAKRDLRKELFKARVDTKISLSILSAIGLADSRRVVSDNTSDATTNITSSSNTRETDSSSHSSNLHSSHSSNNGRILNNPTTNKHTLNHAQSIQNLSHPTNNNSTQNDDKLTAYLHTIKGAEVDKSSLPPITFQNPKSFAEQLSDIEPCFEGKESDANWLAREKSIIYLRRVLRGNGPTEYLSVFLNCFKRLNEGVLKAVNSLRTTLSTHGCQFVKEVYAFYGQNFDFYAENYLHAMVKLSASTKKIAAQNAQSTGALIIANSPTNIKLLNAIHDTATDKNAFPRTCSAIWLMIYLIVQFKNNHSLDHLNTEQIESIIKKGVADANPTVRANMRSVFWEYISYSSSRAQAIVDSLDSSVKKALEKSNPHPNSFDSLFNSSSSSVTNIRKTDYSNSRDHKRVVSGHGKTDESEIVLPKRSSRKEHPSAYPYSSHRSNDSSSSSVSSSSTNHQLRDKSSTLPLSFFKSGRSGIGAPQRNPNAKHPSVSLNKQLPASSTSLFSASSTSSTLSSSNKINTNDNGNFNSQNKEHLFRPSSYNSNNSESDTNESVGTILSNDRFNNNNSNSNNAAKPLNDNTESGSNISATPANIPSKNFNSELLTDGDISKLLKSPITEECIAGISAFAKYSSSVLGNRSDSYQLLRKIVLQSRNTKLLSFIYSIPILKELANNLPNDFLVIGGVLLHTRDSNIIETCRSIFPDLTCIMECYNFLLLPYEEQTKIYGLEDKYIRQAKVYCLVWIDIILQDSYKNNSLIIKDFFNKVHFESFVNVLIDTDNKINDSSVANGATLSIFELLWELDSASLNGVLVPSKNTQSLIQKLNSKWKHGPVLDNTFSNKEINGKESPNTSLPDQMAHDSSSSSEEDFNDENSNSDYGDNNGVSDVLMNEDITNAALGQITMIKLDIPSFPNIPDKKQNIEKISISDIKQKEINSPKDSIKELEFLRENQTTPPISIDNSSDDLMDVDSEHDNDEDNIESGSVENNNKDESTMVVTDDSAVTIVKENNNNSSVLKEQEILSSPRKFTKEEEILAGKIKLPERTSSLHKVHNPVMEKNEHMKKDKEEKDSMSENSKITAECLKSLRESKSRNSWFECAQKYEEDGEGGRIIEKLDYNAIKDTLDELSNGKFYTNSFRMLTSYIRYNKLARQNDIKNGEKGGEFISEKFVKKALEAFSKFFAVPNQPGSCLSDCFIAIKFLLDNVNDIDCDYHFMKNLIFILGSRDEASLYLGAKETLFDYTQHVPFLMALKALTKIYRNKDIRPRGKSAIIKNIARIIRRIKNTKNGKIDDNELENMIKDVGIVICNALLDPSVEVRRSGVTASVVLHSYIANDVRLYENVLIDVNEPHRVLLDYYFQRYEQGTFGDSDVFVS